MKINVLFNGNTNHPSGGYKVIYEYCNRLSEEGHTVIINYLYGPMFSERKIPDILRKPLVKLFTETIGPGFWFKLNKNISKKVLSSSNDMKEADIVIATAYETAKLVKDLPKSCGKKVYFIQDYETWGAVSENNVNETYCYGMNNLVVSNWLKKKVEEISERTAVLIPNSVDTSIFFNKNIFRHEKSIVFFYRSSEHKGSKYAIEVVRLIKSIYPELVVNVITPENDLPIFPEYFHIYQKINPKKVSEVLNKSTIFICTSIEEGFGLPGLEAMACGCAVVSTSYKGVLEYAVNGKNSLLSPIRDVRSMYKNIISLFEHDNLRLSIIKEGYKTASERSLYKSSKKLENIFLQLINDEGVN